MEHCRAKSSTGKMDHVQFTNKCSNCTEIGGPVCAIRPHGEGYKIRTFRNACQLHRYNCIHENDLQFEATDSFICSNYKNLENEEENEMLDEEKSLITPEEQDLNNPIKSKNINEVRSMTDPRNVAQFGNKCSNCAEIGGPVCAIRPHGEGYKIRTFQNACQLHRYNCVLENDLKFAATEPFICSNYTNLENEEENEMLDAEKLIVTPEENGLNNPIKAKNIIVVRSMIDPRNINESISNFFAATHLEGLRIKNMESKFNESTRRRLIRIFGPVKVFEPWTKIPVNVAEGEDYEPTLRSCYHKCPTECPDTYAPVCGVPGIQAREPRLTFLNHCFMDMAQCKMHKEDKSDTAASSAYIENSFLFCLGDELNSLYQFMPLIRTLQHMGRLKKKGTYKRRVHNFRFLNGHPRGDVSIMGKKK